MSGDVVFDRTGDALADQVYASTKGAVRLEVLWRRLTTDVAAVKEATGLRVIDVGAGTAHITWRTASGQYRAVGDPPEGAQLIEPNIEDSYLMLVGSAALEGEAQAA